MPHTSALRQGAGRADSGPARRRPTSSSRDERLAQLSSRLDVLIRDVGLGANSHRELERQIEEAEAIAAGLRAVFRSPTRAENPPRWQDGQGRAAW